MKLLWSYIEEKQWRADKKYLVTLLILGTVFALAGLAVWFIIHNWALSSLEWMFCFAGYPVIASWFVVFFYSCRHSYHDYS